MDLFTKDDVIPPTIIYVMIARGEVPLAHFSPHTGTFRRACISLLRYLDVRTPRLTCMYDGYRIDVLNSQDRSGLIIMSLCEPEFPQDFNFQLLDAVKLLFVSHFTTADFESAFLLEMVQPFALVLKNVVTQYCTDVVKYMQKKKKADDEFSVSKIFLPYRSQRIPLLVQSIVGEGSLLFHRGPKGSIGLGERLLLRTSAGKRKRKVDRESAFYRRHPFIVFFIGLFIAVLLFYLALVVPLCGWDLNKKNERGESQCWLNIVG